MVAKIQAEEPWKKSLRALIQTADPSLATAPKALDKRLIWLVGYENGSLTLEPVEQKRTARGIWSKGRPVSLSRIFSGDKLEFVTEQDQTVRAAVEREVRYHYYGTQYRLSTEKAILTLIGHPLLFLKESPGTSVELVRGEPEIIVTRSGKELHIQFSTQMTDSPIVVEKDSPSRFKVLELSEEHRRMARILGEKGLTVRHRPRKMCWMP